MNKTHKSEIAKFKDIPIGQLREPPCEDRFDLELTDEESAFIKEIPLAVVYSKESRAYIIVKGRRRFLRAKALGFASLPCVVLQELEHEWESLLVRLDYVLEVAKPFHVLEMARLVYQIREKEILHNGREAYGYARLKRLVEERAVSAQELGDRVIQDLDRFMGDAEWTDDVTLIVVRTL